MPYLLFLAAAATGALLFFLSHEYRRKKRHELLRSKPAPPEWKTILNKNFPLIEKLSEEQRQKLFGTMHIFMAEKKFEGCGGLELTNEMIVTVTAQACMLLIGRNSKVYPRLKTVLLYPHAYTDGETARQGESWGLGVVVLSWDNVVGGARNVKDAHNVTFHEFAHQLDQEDGIADGAPIFEENSAYATWARVCKNDFEELVDKTEHGKRDILDSYGATNPAEFFAVATETFFEKPRHLQKNHPELYEKFKKYYQLDPLQWI